MWYSLHETGNFVCITKRSLVLANNIPKFWYILFAVGIAVYYLREFSIFIFTLLLSNKFTFFQINIVAITAFYCLIRSRNIFHEHAVKLDH